MLVTLVMALAVSAPDPDPDPIPSQGATVIATASGSVVSASDYDLYAASASVVALFPERFRLWVGATESLTGVSPRAPSQTSLMAGVGLDRAPWHVDLAGGALLASSGQWDGAPLGWGRLAYYPSVWGARLEVAALGAKNGLVVQIDPRLVWQPRLSFGLALGGELTLVGDKPYASVRVEAAWSPTDALTFDVRGSVGARRTPIDDAGLSVWASTEVYAADVSLGATLAVGSDVSLFGRFEARDGDALRLGGTLGLSLIL